MTWKRKPSHFGSCSQSPPLGGRAAEDGTSGWINARRAGTAPHLSRERPPARRPFFGSLRHAMPPRWPPYRPPCQGRTGSAGRAALFVVGQILPTERHDLSNDRQAEPVGIYPAARQGSLNSGNDLPITGDRKIVRPRSFANRQQGRPEWVAWRSHFRRAKRAASAAFRHRAFRCGERSAVPVTHYKSKDK